MTRHIFAACGAIAIAGLTLSAQTPQSSPTQPPGARTPDANGRTTTMTGCLKPWDGTMGAGSVGSTSTPGSGSAGAGSTGAGSTGAGSGSAMGAGAQFVLTDISEGGNNSAMGRTPGAGSGAPGSGTTTTPTPNPSMGHGSIVVKADDASINLKQHVNQKVEVTGTLASDMGMDHSRPDSMRGTESGSTPGTPGSTPGTPGSTPGTPGSTPGSTGSPSTMGKPSADQMKMPTFTVTALKMVSATCD
jgi:hypothetical protein